MTGSSQKSVTLNLLISTKLVPRRYQVYIGIDPGGTTGIALVSFKPELTAHPQLIETIELPYLEVIDFLQFKQYTLPLDGIICEEYKLFKHKAVQQSGSKMEAAKVCGMLEYISFTKGISLSYQSPQIKTLGESIAKAIESTTTKTNWHGKYHARDAWWHVLAYLVRTKQLCL